MTIQTILIIAEMNYLYGIIMSGKNNNPITNQTITVKTIECSMSPTESSFMTCEFVDEQDIAKEVNNIIFFNFDAPPAEFEMHRDISTGEAVLNVDFDTPTKCEIMGQNARGLTVNCPKS